MSRTLRLAKILIADSQNKKKQALDLINSLAPEGELTGVWWNNKENSIYVSNGDWAEYDNMDLFKKLQKLLGKDHVQMESEAGPSDDSEWEKVI